MTTLALVIPCYNEYLRLQPDAFISALRTYPWLSICFVDDGSSDKTAETLKFMERESPSINALYLPHNVGKSEAVRAGIRYLLEYSHSDIFGYWDADLATPLTELPEFMQEYACSPKCESVIGTRWPHLGAHINRSESRNLTGELMRFLIHFVLQTPVYDTQCGAKIFSRKLAAEIFARPFISPWLFDVELLSRIGKERLNIAVRELPISSWDDVPGSHLGISDTFRIFRDLIRIALNNQPVRVNNKPLNRGDASCAF